MDPDYPTAPETGGPIPAAIFPDLNGPQSRGQACIVCRAKLTLPDAPVPEAVIVGRSGSTGRVVRACRDRCAPLIGYVPPSRAVQQTLL